MKQKDATVKDLESYIDNLLVRVMESTPKILQSEIEERQGSPMRNLSFTNMNQVGRNMNTLSSSPTVRMVNYSAQQRNLNVQINFNNSNSAPNTAKSTGKTTTNEKKKFSLFKKGR